MNDPNAKPYRPRDTKEADDAMDRLHARGFRAFRNGRVIAPDRNSVTPNDQADFDIVKGTYPNSVLI